MRLGARIDRYLASTTTHLAVLAARAVLRQSDVRRRLDLLAESQLAGWRATSSNPIQRAGRKLFSQNDEDGIIAEIARRLRLDRGTFVEFGVGDGLENNTLALLMAGWSGAWLGGEQLAFRVPPGCRRLAYKQAWITRENCEALLRETLPTIGAKDPDLVSVDLDGNDVYVVETLLSSGLRPAIFVVEYNGKFAPPTRFAVSYDPTFAWDGTDYFGASLQRFADVFDAHGYRLVCCNVTGLNAFFVQKSTGDCFADVPQDLSELYMPPRYFGPAQAGHPASPRTIERFLQDDSTP